MLTDNNNIKARSSRPLWPLAFVSIFGITGLDQFMFRPTVFPAYIIANKRDKISRYTAGWNPNRLSEIRQMRERGVCHMRHSDMTQGHRLPD